MTKKEQELVDALETLLAAIRYRTAALTGDDEQMMDYANQRFWQATDEAEALMQEYRNEVFNRTNWRLRRIPACERGSQLQREDCCGSQAGGARACS